MRQSNAQPETGELGYAAWIAFWAQLAILALLAVVGALVASGNEEPGDYTCGLTLALAAIALALMRIKGRFDGAPSGWGSFLLVDDMPNLIAVIVVFAIVALVGIVAAAGLRHGALYDAGVALAVVSAIGILLSMKRVFDNLEGRG